MGSSSGHLKIIFCVLYPFVECYECLFLVRHQLRCLVPHPATVSWSVEAYVEASIRY